MYEPYLSSPPNGATDQALYPLLTWTDGDFPPEPGAVWEIYFSATGAFAGEQYFVAIGLDAQAIHSYQLEPYGPYPGTPNTTFYWRVEYYAGGPKEPSEIWSFTTGEGSSSSSSSSSLSSSSNSSSSSSSSLSSSSSSFSSSSSSSSSSFSSSSSSSSSDAPADFSIAANDWIRDTTKFASNSFDYEAKPALHAGALSADALATTGVDKIWDAIAAELTAVPSATPKVREALMLLYMSLRNKETTTTSARTLSDDSDTIIATSALTDDGTTFIKAKLVS